eukprot:6276662-Amphidinium_carterae.2
MSLSEENVTFKKPPGDPSHCKIKAKAKSTPITTHHVTSSTGEERNKWVTSINKELDSFYSSHAVGDATAESLSQGAEKWVLTPSHARWSTCWSQTSRRHQDLMGQR